MHASLLLLCFLLVSSFARAARPVPSAAGTGQPVLQSRESVTTNPGIQGGLPRVDPASFGEIKWESLPKGPDGNRIVGTVNEKPISADRFRSHLNKTLGGAAKSDSPEIKGMQKALAEPAFEALVYEILYEQFAAENGLRVTDAEVEEEIRTANLLRPPGNKLQDEAFASGRTAEEVRQDIRAQLIAEKVERFVGDQFTTASLSQEKMEPFLSSSGGVTSSTPEIRAQHIVFRATPDMSPEAIEDARARAEQVLQQIRSGRDFTEVARQNSQDRRTTRNGGDLGYFTPGRMFPEFDKVAFSLKPGEVSDVVRTPVGFHIIKVNERHANDARSRYWEYLRAQHVNHWRQRLLRSARIERFL